MKRLLCSFWVAVVLMASASQAYAQPCPCGCGKDFSQCDPSCSALQRWKQEQQYPTYAMSQWGASQPPAEVRAAINAAVNNPAMPKGLKAVFAAGKVQFVYRSGVPRDLAYSIWFLKDRTLAVGPAFQDLGAKAQSQLLVFEFGKLLQREHDRDSAFRTTIAKYPLPADLRSLPDVPELSGLEQDYPSMVGYAYYRYLFDRQSLIDRGLGGLVRSWDANPPHATLR